jgi:protein-tyrosine phosphatase
MIDIHSHVLPGVDDGSQSMEESLALLAQAADSGVSTLVATPHCNIPDEYENYAGPALTALFEELDQAREEAGIPLRLCRGMEVFATEDLPELLRDGKIWTLNGSRYFLMEFAFQEDPDFCGEILRRCRKQGFRPVIAHPERYEFVQADPQLAFEWCISGCALQINKGSILGRFGPEPRRMAELLLEHGLAACAASDAHSPYQRSTHMGELRHYLIMEYGEAYCRLLLEENPARILDGRELLGYEPIPFW